MIYTQRGKVIFFSNKFKYTGYDASLLQKTVAHAFFPTFTSSWPNAKFAWAYFRTVRHLHPFI